MIFLGSILAWIGFDEHRSRRAYAAALLLFAMACLSKTSVVPMSGVLLVIAWWRRGRLTWVRDVLPVLPFAALGLGAGLFTAWVERHHVGATGADFQVLPLQRLQIAGRALWFYLGKLIWPADLRFVYPRWELDPSEAGPYVQLAAWLALLAVLWSLRRRARGPLAGMLIFTGLLVPVIGVVVHYYYVFSFVADHWQYLASLGVIALLSAGATLLADRARLRSRLARAALCAALLGTLGGMTWKQCHIYTDAETHYRAMLAGNPGCWLAHNNLGILLVDSGRVPEGIEHYEQALRLRPGYGEAHHNFGIALAKLGRTREAIEQYRASLQAKPDAFESLFNLGNLSMKLGRAPDALACYEQALRINPDASDVSNNLGKALILVGKTPEGIAVLEAALARRPDFAKGHVSLADALLKSGRVAEAIEHYETALRLRPGDETVRSGLAAAQSMLSATQGGLPASH